MLVLNRKVNERIKVGNDIEIVILSVHGQRVAIGIKAPENVTILREELINESPKYE